MVTNLFLTLILKIVSPLFSLLKPISIVVNSELLEVVFDIVASILYFLPVDTINTILGITLATWIIRVVISFLRTLWSILPIV